MYVHKLNNACKICNVDNAHNVSNNLLDCLLILCGSDKPELRTHLSVCFLYYIMAFICNNMLVNHHILVILEHLQL